MRGSKNLFPILVASLFPSVVFAQGALTGTVRDTSGAVLPGVTVEASSPALIEKVRTGVTDGFGQYRIIELNPGTYALTFSLTGFGQVRREGIELAGSATVTIPIEMRIGSVKETITVTGETPVVDVQTARRETVLAADVMAVLPATRSYGALLNAIPGLTVDNNGLASTPTMTFFSARGGSIDEGRVTINGMTVAAPFGGAGVSTLTYDTANAEEISVLVSGGLGESDTGGPVMNIVPRSGGNRFAGQAFWSGAGNWSRGDNLDDFLRSIGITRGPGVISSYDASGSYGGPIKRDRLWFFGSYRKFSTTRAVEGVFANVSAGNPSRWDYVRDDRIEARDADGRDIYQMRFAAQITSRNRINFSHEHQRRCEGSTLTPSGDGCRTRGEDWIALGSSTGLLATGGSSPEASTAYFNWPYKVTQVMWTSPLTNRLLFEAGYSRFVYPGGGGELPPDGIVDLIPVTEQSAAVNPATGRPYVPRANFVYRGVATYSDNYSNPNNWRASASYVTGSHNMKIGYQGAYQIADNRLRTNESQLAYRFNQGVPNQFTFRLPNWQTSDRTSTSALYVQDTWTRGRLTLQGALRYDRAWSFSPAEHNGTADTSPFNIVPITFERTVSVNAFNDISPRVGVAYDLFGNGKTALKFNLGRYLDAATNDSAYTRNNPAQSIVGNLGRIVTSVNRNWSDGNGNRIVDCDILNPAEQNNLAAGGDSCGQLTGNSLNFGRAGNNLTQVNPKTLEGWGVRANDWQWGVNVQHELLPRVSLDAGYNRRSWGGFVVTDDLARSAADYEPWTVTAPTDSRLPGGGGYPVTVYTLTAAASLRPAQNYITFETDFGPARINYWHGVDVTLNARLRNALTLQVGTSTGREIEDRCGTLPKIDSPDPRNCLDKDPVQTTLRGLATYTIPKINVLVSATLRSQPPFQLTVTAISNGASWNVPNTIVQQLLGRIPPGGLPNGNTNVSLLDETHRVYGDTRRNQVDMRFAKIVRVVGTRADLGVDLYNLLNTNYAVTYATQYEYGVASGGAWLNPSTILAPRFVRLNATLSF